MEVVITAEAEGLWQAAWTDYPDEDSRCRYLIRLMPRLVYEYGPDVVGSCLLSLPKAPTEDDLITLLMITRPIRRVIQPQREALAQRWREVLGEDAEDLLSTLL